MVINAYAFNDNNSLNYKFKKQKNITKDSTIKFFK